MALWFHLEVFVLLFDNISSYFIILLNFHNIPKFTYFLFISVHFSVSNHTVAGAI